MTVLMPVFNRERFLDDAIASVLRQDFADLELLLVDDGSTDGTPALLRTWRERDPRVVIVTAPQNQGISAALNLGLRHARAEYIARLDSDDIMMPHRLAAQAALLDRDAGVVLASSAYEIVDANLNYRASWRGEEPHAVVAYFLNFYNFVGGHGQVMFRRAEVLGEGGYDGRYAGSEDYDLWTRLLQRGRIVTLPLVGMKHRDHDRRATSLYASVKHANWTAIMTRSLRSYLGRDLRDEEIAALITLWRLNGATGMVSTADRATNGKHAEAARYVARAASWTFATVVRAAMNRPD